MKYIVENSIDDFPAWSGGYETLETVRKAGREYIDKLDKLVEEVFSSVDGDIPEDGDINNYLWFEADEIYKHLGLTEDGEIPEDGEGEEDSEDE